MSPLARHGSVSLYTNPSSKCTTCMTGTSQAERECCDNMTMLGLALMKKSVIRRILFCLIPLNTPSSLEQCVNGTTVMYNSILSAKFHFSCCFQTESSFRARFPFTIEGISNEWMVCVYMHWYYFVMLIIGSLNYTQCHTA